MAKIAAEPTATTTTATTTTTTTTTTNYTNYNNYNNYNSFIQASAWKRDDHPRPWDDLLATYRSRMHYYLFQDLTLRL